MHTKPNRSTSIRASGNSTSVSPCQGDSAPHRGVSFYLLQLWVYQDGLGYCEHHLSLFSPLLFHDALSRIMFLRLNLSSFLHSTNMLEHLLKGKVLLLACLWPLGLYSSSCPVLLFFFPSLLEVCANVIALLFLCLSSFMCLHHCSELGIVLSNCEGRF